MSKEVASLIVEVKSDQVPKANKRLKKLGDTGKNLTSRLSKMSSAAKAFGAALAGASAAAGFMVSKQIEAADNIQKLSIRLGESTEALSQYAHVADITGVSFEDIANSFAKLQKNLADASSGIGLAKNALAKLNINVSSLIDLRPSEQFEILADAINKIEKPAIRTQIAMDLMGRSGSRMLSTMAEGGVGIRKIRDEFDAMGGTLSQLDANQIASTNDAFTRMSERLSITAKTFTIAMAPALQDFAEYMSDAFASISDFNEGLKVSFVLGINTGIFSDNFAALGERIGEVSERIVSLRAGGEEYSSKIMIENQALLDVLIAQSAELQKQAGIYTKPTPITITPNEATDEELKAAEAQRLYNIRENERQIKIVKDNFRKIEAAEAKSASDKQIMFDREAGQAKLNTAASIFGNLSKLVNTNSKKAFEASKVLARSEVILSTIASAQKAYESMSKFGPIVAGAAAVSAGLAGLARLKQINSTSFSGGGSPSVSASSGSNAFESQSVNQNANNDIQPQTNIIQITLGGRVLAETIVEGNRIAFDNDMQTFETEDGYKKVVMR